MSDLISRQVEPAASSWLIQRARALGADLDFERHLGIEYVSRQINEAIGVESNAFVIERVFWYLHSVLRHRRSESWPSPDESGASDETIRSLAERFAAERDALKSMQRGYADGSPYTYATFGDGYGGTLSTRTLAYARAVEMLTESGVL